MKRLLCGLTAIVLTLALGVTANAQWYGNHNVNVISHSGNGYGNTIVAHNSVSGGLGYGNGYHHAGFNGYGYGNGYGNGYGCATPPCTVPASAGCYSGYPGYHGGGSVNVNVITNSANGYGNTVLTGNQAGGRGTVNINVITNSGNGTGNTIVAGNHGR